jgi:pimeloyl-ACP methyl ester carboxylesterase
VVSGWPGSILEVGKIIDRLTNPENTSTPAFHVVAPSHPGTAFSPAPKDPNFGLSEIGSSFNNLMVQLGYPKYVGQGGDWGGFILRIMAGDWPGNLISMHSNYWYEAPNAADLQRYAEGTSTEQEKICIEAYQNFGLNLSGYMHEQETRPLQLAIGMTDSPLGFTSWVYDFMFLHVDQYWWTCEEIITFAMMYYIPGPYAGFRFYKSAFLVSISGDERQSNANSTVHSRELVMVRTEYTLSNLWLTRSSQKTIIL